MELATRQLGKAYGYFWALRDINLKLSPGDCIALLGPNGAGKTTLLRVLTGLLAPTTGAVFLNGMPGEGDHTEKRRQIGLLAPADHLYENLTVKENLIFFTRLYDRDVSRATLDEALNEVGLAGRHHEFVGNLSAGMKCRLSIAKWRLLDPGLLLLDEPYGVLDGSGIDLLEAFLLEQCAKGHIVIMASHHVSRVLKLCSRALILHQGRLTFNEAKQSPWPSFDRAFSAFLPQA